MKPLSACTTPRKLMAPISRHFLPVLQPEPPAWLTTGLIKGSRLPFAAYLLSGTTCSSLTAPSELPETLPRAALASAGGLLFGTIAVVFACALRPATTPGLRFAPPVFFAPAGLAPAWVEEDFTGVTTATPLDLAAACLALA